MYEKKVVEYEILRPITNSHCWARNFGQLNYAMSSQQNCDDYNLMGFWVVKFSHIQPNASLWWKIGPNKEDPSPPRNGPKSKFKPNRQMGPSSSPTDKWVQAQAQQVSGSKSKSNKQMGPSPPKVHEVSL